MTDAAIVSPEEATLTPIDLPGEPDTDRGFRLPDGTAIRVRIVKASEHAASAPTNTKVSLAPAGVSLTLTIALLDADLNVVKDGAERLMITDRHDLSLAAFQIANLGTEVGQTVDAWLRRRAAAFQSELIGRSALASYLETTWGGAPLVGASAAELPLLPPPMQPPPVEAAAPPSAPSTE